MEQLDPSDRERIKKMSEEAIKKHMEKEGWTPEQLRGVPLAKLKEALAQRWVERREEELQGAVGGEVQEREAGDSVEGVKEENETVEIVRMKLEVEREKIALEREKVQIKRMELQQMAGLKKEKLKILQEKNEAEKKRMESTVYQAKLFSDALRGMMARMPSDPIEMMAYFRTVEKLFADFKVEETLKVHLLKPHLTEQARVLVAKMDPAKCSDYDEVKKLLLHEFKLSSSALLEKFNSLEPSANETYTLFGNRLMSVLTYYVENRNAKSYEQLMQLLVCDRIKSKLSQAALQHVLSLEHKADDGWLKLSELLEAVDLYYDTHLSTDKPRTVESAVSKLNDSKSTPKTPQMKPGHGPGNFKNGKQTQTDKPAKRCYVCGFYNHLAVNHGKPNTSGNSNSARRASVVNEGGSKFVNACTTAVESLSGGDEMRSSLAPEPQADTVVKMVDVNHVEVSSRSWDSPGAWSTIDCGGLAQAACVCEVDSASQLTSQFALLSYLGECGAKRPVRVRCP